MVSWMHGWQSQVKWLAESWKPVGRVAGAIFFYFIFILEGTPSKLRLGRDFPRPQIQPMGSRKDWQSASTLVVVTLKSPLSQRSTNTPHLSGA